VTTTRRRLLSAATAAVLVAVGAGSVWGRDDHFPFGPFRMYSTTTPSSGNVFIPVFVGTTARGATIHITPSQVGLRRAEVLGRLRHVRRDPRLLRHYAEAYERLHPQAGSLVAMDLVYEVHQLRSGRPVSFERRTILQWEET
jgi:hypothetical protein